MQHRSLSRTRSAAHHGSQLSRRARSFTAAAISIALGIGCVSFSQPAYAEPPEGTISTKDTESAKHVNNINPMFPEARHHFIRTRDGLKVSVYEYGSTSRTRDTIVMTGGYPWTSSGMDPIAKLLATKYHVVRYDHRASGESDHPEDHKYYRLEPLANEMLDVIDATAKGRKIHVFGEAWCPFIASQAQFMRPGSITTLTSLGAPSLDLAANEHYRVQKEGTLKDRIEDADQVARIWYIWLMRGREIKKPSPAQKALKWLFFESGNFEFLMNFAMGQLSGDFNALTTTEDAIRGINMYRYGFIEHFEKPQYDYLDIPVVHVLHMENDVIEGEFLLRGLEERTPHYIRHDLTADHLSWVTYITSLTDYVDQSISTYYRLHPSR